MKFRRIGLASALAVTALVRLSHAQEPNPTTNASSATPDTTLQRITPLDEDPGADDMLTTHPVKPHPKPVAVAAPPPSSDAPPPASVPPAPTPPAPPTHSSAQPNSYQPVPFGHASMPAASQVPSGPHSTEAVPVGTVDAIAVSEPAPPTPVAPGADPVKEDAAAPTEFNSPIFEGLKDDGLPRKISIRALNKVTAQSVLYKLRPGETANFGRLQITALMCHTSIPTSQTDYAGLLDIQEKLPGKDGIKPIFHGWMYASSPSVASLEHPIYDVTMVACDIATPEPKDEPKTDKKPAAKTKKSS